MSDFPTGFRVAQFLGLSGAAWLSGNIACFSLVTVPTLIESAREYKVPITLIVKQWQTCYTKGKNQNPAIAALTASAFGYLALSVRDGSALAPLVSPDSVMFYTSAAALTLGIVPFTVIAMARTNNTLIEWASSTWVPSEESTREVERLLKRWTGLNAIRSLFPLMGAIAGFLAL